MLSLVWAVKYFRSYLFGRRFVVSTDHSALIYLKKFAKKNSRVMRWSLKLTKFNFTVERKARMNISRVDALTWYFATVLHGEGLGPGVFCFEKAKDKFCQNIKPVTYADKCIYWTTQISYICSVPMNDNNCFYNHDHVFYWPPTGPMYVLPNRFDFLVARYAKINQALHKEKRRMQEREIRSRI